MRVSVYVLNIRAKPLMPCSRRKARILLKEGKARVVKRTPFVIQLTYPTGESKQAVSLGVDSGYKHIGLSAITTKEEIYSADVKLREDIVKLNSERRQYRRARRQRKSWYRKPRFLNRRKAEGWLAPSIQHKLDSHLKTIEQVKKILPITQIVIEVAAFDIQKIKNPEIEGVKYQKGEQEGFFNIREYVLYRDGHICQQCKGKKGKKGKSKNRVLEVHHIVSRQIGGNRPDNLVTLCHRCHEKVSQGKLVLDIKPSKNFKAETFMTAIRWRLINKLREVGEVGEVEQVVSYTYGYITKAKRIELRLSKSHVNDAFVIAGGNEHLHLLAAVSYLIQQVRKCNRKLFKGDRSHIRNTADRFIKGFQRFDKVLWKGEEGKGVECFVFGRRSRGYFDLRKLDGTKIHPSVNCKQLTLLESAKTFLIEGRNGNSSHPLKGTGLLAVNL